jgi:hypothetical protein
MTSAKRHFAAALRRKPKSDEHRNRWLGATRESSRLAQPTPADLDRLLARALGAPDPPNKVYYRDGVVWCVHEPYMPPIERHQQDNEDGTNSD